VRAANTVEITAEPSNPPQRVGELGTIGRGVLTAQISRSWNVLSTFFVINAMQGPQRPRRASTQALATMTTPEQRNSFEAAQVFKATTRFVVVDN